MPTVFLGLSARWATITCRRTCRELDGMRIGKSVRKAIDEMMIGDTDAAMLHACNAVDGTAKRVFPSLGNRSRFVRLLRENYGILGPMGAPGIDLEATRFPVAAPDFRSQDGSGDMAEIIYAIHRCTHGHGDELPEGFELLSDANGPARRTQMVFGAGKVRLSDRIVFGLIAVAVLHPINSGERISSAYFLTYGETTRMVIQDWWGEASRFPEVVASDPVPSIKILFPKEKP